MSAVFRLVLINMPFADWYRPSFALSQLAALVDRDFAGEVEVEVLYPNMDFARDFGLSTYDAIADADHAYSGLGDWLFSHIAFPDQPDLAAEYLRRYYRGGRWSALREHVLQFRAGLTDWCARLIERHDLAAADAVGLTSMFTQHVPSLALARMMKDRSPETRVLLGGANCEAPMGSVIAEHVPSVDFVFSGPALHTLPRLLRCLLDGRVQDADRIAGVATAGNCHDPRFRTAIGAERDIDDYFTPDYSSFQRAVAEHEDLFAEGAADDRQPILYFETSRGCWWGERSHCTFCGLNGLGMTYRSMSADLAVTQLEWLFTFAPWCTTYCCTDNIMPKSYPRDVFSRLDPPPGSSIFYEVKLPLSEKDMKAMVAASVTRVQPGIEALSSRTLALMRKGTNVFQNLQFLKNCNRFGMEPAWNLLIGFPGEPEDVYEKYVQDIALLTHLQPPSGVGTVRFDRYSPYFTRPEEYGLNLRPMDYYRFVYPFPDAALEQLAYFFADDDLAPYRLATARWWPAIQDLVRQWRQAWKHGGTPPRLSATPGPDGSWLLHDSRPVLDQPGEPPAARPDAVTTTGRPIDDLEVTFLRRLSSPARPDRLASELELTQAQVDAVLASMRARRLLFDEDGRVLSLVVLEEEPALAVTAA